MMIDVCRTLMADERKRNDDLAACRCESLNRIIEEISFALQLAKEYEVEENMLLDVYGFEPLKLSAVNVVDYRQRRRVS